jgi:hypothetical protein
MPVLPAGFWKTIATYAVKIAMYAADHPDQVIAIVNDLRPGTVPTPKS